MRTGIVRIKHRLEGKKFGKLLVLEESERSRNRFDGQSRRNYRCRCECGNEAIVAVPRLVSGTTRSCGCLAQDPALTHGHSRRGRRTPTYEIWIGMKSRCRNKKLKIYKNYGGRGIKVCDRWQGKEGYRNFLADMGERPERMSLDRINNNGDYEPSNCRWASQEEQHNNKRNNVRLKDGEAFLTMAELARKYGINYPKLKRLNQRGQLNIETIRRLSRDT